MKPKKPTITELDDNYSEIEETDSETEALQQAFADGTLKPGLNVPEKAPPVNNVKGLLEKLEVMKQELPWEERLDMTCVQASMAPELALQLDELKKKPYNLIAFDDLKRESIFYRQAQKAVLEALPKLKKLGILTHRPEDYFAEMAKTDAHMQKVKARLIQEKAKTERIEKVRQIRKQRKLQKALQAESKVSKVNSKREMMNELKKFRKGERKDLSFLDDKPNKATQKKMSNPKRQMKDAKFGFGGKKRGSKLNTKESTNRFGAQVRSNKPQKGKGKTARPGKNRRKEMKSKKK